MTMIVLDARSRRRDAGASPERGGDRIALLEMVTTSLRKAEKIAAELRRKNTLLVLTGISSSALCTLVAGFTAAQGPVGGQRPTSWRLACLVAAVLAFLATLSIGLGQQLRISDRLSGANQAIGRLRSLDVLIVTSSRDWEEISQAYAEIEAAFPEYCEPPSWPGPALWPWPPPPWPPASPAVAAAQDAATRASLPPPK